MESFYNAAQLGSVPSFTDCDDRGHASTNADGAGAVRGNLRGKMTVARLRLRRATAVAALAVVALGAARAQAQARASPSAGLEQQSLEEALARSGLVVDPSPAGKTIGTIYVVNGDVFSRRDWYFQWFNLFHRTTREDILRRELLFRAGQPDDEALVEESMRNLQAPPTVTLATGQSSRACPSCSRRCGVIVPVGLAAAGDGRCPRR